MRCLWLALAITGTLAAQGDPRELVRQSIRNGEQSWRQSFSYYCVKTDIERQFDSNHKVKSRSDDVYDLIPLGYNTDFEMPVRHNNEPISHDRRAKAQQELAQRRAESPAQKKRRFQKDIAERSYMKEVPDAFDFKVVGEEKLPSGPAWVLDATPHRGYQPKSRYAHMFPSMRGKLWIDKKDMQWVKADAEAMQPVRFGVFIARIAKGSHIVLEQMKLPDGSWVPKHLAAKASARTFLFFNHVFDEDITYSDYRKQAPELAFTKPAQ